MGTETQSGGAAEWGSDFFGSLNELPPEPVVGIGHILEAMATLPAYQEGRRWLLANLGISPGSSVVEAGCGTGAALADTLSIVGTKGRVAGYDPTKAFVDSARTRAQKLGASNVRYAIGDIRAWSGNGESDARSAKVLIHAGPPKVALSDGTAYVSVDAWVSEWLPYFAVSSTRPETLEALNAFWKACYDYSSA
jgi:tRNA A58 N-methylase Trm61